MRTQTIAFLDYKALGVFPQERSNLKEGLAKLGLQGRHPVIVLIGGEVAAQERDVSLRAIEAISKTASYLNAVVITGGIDTGVMSEIGKTRSQNHYKFPLIGITPEALVTWPGGPHSGKFLGWGEKRMQLEPHYSHFVFVPGNQFGDEASWIIDAATILAKDRPSLTILIGGGEVSRKDIELSLAIGRRVIALSRTGQLADDFARQPERNKMITVIPASAEKRLVEAIHTILSIDGDGKTEKSD